MSNATQSLAGTRITSLLDANSFVEIGQSVTARNTDFNMTEKKAPSDGVITGFLFALNANRQHRQKLPRRLSLSKFISPNNILQRTDPF